MLIFLKKKKKKKIPISPARISRKNSPSSVEGTDARPRAQNQSPRAQTRFYSVVGLASSSSSSSQRASSFFGVLLLRVFFLSSHPSAVSVSPRSPFDECSSMTPLHNSFSSSSSSSSSSNKRTKKGTTTTSTTTTVLLYRESALRAEYATTLTTKV